MKKFWQDHSLTIILAAIGLALLAIAIPFREGTWFDTILGLGHGALTAALLYFLSAYFREKNKPEDPPQ
jgi:hypothetical protein